MRELLNVFLKPLSLRTVLPLLLTPFPFFLLLWISGALAQGTASLVLRVLAYPSLVVTPVVVGNLVRCNQRQSSRRN
jgi:hypothetical protein